MFRFLPLMRVFFRSLELMEILIWEGKILIKEFWIISWNLSKRNLTLISQQTKELFKNSKDKFKKEKELCPHNMKLKFKSKILFKVMTSLRVLQEPDSRKSMEIYSKKPFNHLSSLFKELDSRRMRLIKLSWSEDQPEFLKSGS